jgi:signal transduction histidine kinase
VLGRRLLSPLGGLCIFVLIAALVGGGLGWVTRAALKVETAEREATARADAAAKERLALWQLDSRLFPTLAVENGRPYAQYFSLYIPHPVAIDDKGNVNNPGRVPSPLLSAELPDWMLLHFQLDPEKGWFSPQVLPETVADKLQQQLGDEVALSNYTPVRKNLLQELRDKFDVKPTYRFLEEKETAGVSDGVLGVPDYGEQNTVAVPMGAPAAPGGFAPQVVENLAKKADPGRGGPPPQVQLNVQPPPEYQSADSKMRGNKATESDLNVRRMAAERAVKEGQNAQYPMNNTTGRGGYANPPAGSDKPAPPPAPAMPAPKAATPPAGPPAGGRAGGAKPQADAPKAEAPKQRAEPKAAEQAQADALEQPAPAGGLGGKVAFGRGNVPVVEKAPAVQVGPIRPQWLSAEDGSMYLLLVRAARLETKTVFQGVVLDWSRLKDELLDEVKPTFPDAKLNPVYEGEPSNERQMAAIPARLDPGPVPPPEPAGWTPLRLGLALGWGAALVALAGIWFGGRALIDLSERRIRFVSAVTHELRTPLTSLRLYLDLLTSGMIEDEEKQKEYLRTLHGESDRLNRLIENVLDFARLEKRTVQTHVAPTKVDALLEAARAAWADRCAADGKELVVIGTVPVDQMVNTDGRMAGQILSNLIDNARKYSPGAADRRIWVWAKPGDGKRIIFEVEDRGPGVPLAERATIFRPFRRGQAADTTAGGAGLGLALAKQWAEMLGGRLSYRVADGGVGACFRLELPI